MEKLHQFCPISSRGQITTLTSHVKTGKDFRDRKIKQVRGKSISKEKNNLGKYCVAGGPNNQSCKNNSSVPGISMHEFTKPGHKLRDVWIKFVQRRRHHWQPSPHSALCSAHFEPHCLHLRLDIEVEESEEDFETKRVLHRSTAFPLLILFSRSNLVILFHLENADRYVMFVFIDLYGDRWIFRTSVYRFKLLLHLTESA